MGTAARIDPCAAVRVPGEAVWVHPLLLESAHPNRFGSVRDGGRISLWARRDDVPVLVEHRRLAM